MLGNWFRSHLHADGGVRLLWPAQSGYRQTGQMNCRLCVIKDPHVHVSDNVLEAAYAVDGTMGFKVSQIQGVDFGLPAVKYEGKWWMVDQSFLELVWPDFQKRMKLRARPAVKEEQNDYETP